MFRLLVAAAALALLLTGCGGRAPANASATQGTVAADATAAARVQVLTSGDPQVGEPTPTAAPQTSATPGVTCPDAIWWSDAVRHIGQTVAVEGIVYQVRGATGGDPLILDVGAVYPDLTEVVVRLSLVNLPPSAGYLGRTVCATGSLGRIDGYLTMTLHDLADLQIATPP